MSNRLQKGKYTRWTTVSKAVNFFRIGWTVLSRSRDPNMTKNLHVCTICCRPEVVYDVISGWNVKTKRYFVVNFEVASSNSFRDIPKIISWRRRWRQRRTSTTALSENAFAFRLKRPVSQTWREPRVNRARNAEPIPDSHVPQTEESQSGDHSSHPEFVKPPKISYCQSTANSLF